jgi:hypothetical protein
MKKRFIFNVVIAVVIITAIKLPVLGQGCNIDLVGTLYNNWSIAKGVAVAGNYAYIADLGSGLHIVDISDKSTPVEIGSFNIGGGFSASYGVEIAGNYAYMATQTGLYIIDISNPFNPVESGHLDSIGIS